MQKTLAAVLRALAARLDPPVIPVEETLASTQFAGSGLVVNVYGLDEPSTRRVSNQVSWAIKSRPGGSI